MQTNRFPFKKIAIGIVVFLLLIQFFRIDKTNPPVKEELDFIKITNPPVKIGTVLKTSCYDCHSHASTYPWYTNVAPFSWWIKHHINEGREKLNFSEWGNYTSKKTDHKLEECIEQIQEGEMPMSSYLLVHKEAALNGEQKQLLMDWFLSLRKSEER
jgi:hypothetical protein